MMVVFSKTDPRNADSAIIERLAKKLELQTIDDLKTETIAIQSLIQDKGGLNIETKQHIIELLNKFKKLQGLEATDILYQPVINKAITKSTSLILPHEFLCPITLEIMLDPVIIATGQVIELMVWFKLPWYVLETNIIICLFYRHMRRRVYRNGLTQDIRLVLKQDRS